MTFLLVTGNDSDSVPQALSAIGQVDRAGLPLATDSNPQEVGGFCVLHSENVTAQRQHQITTAQRLRQPYPLTYLTQIGVLISSQEAIPRNCGMIRSSEGLIIN